MRRATAFVLLAALGAACVPEFDDDPALVARPRVIAVISNPAEAKPGDAVRVQAIVASPSGPVSTMTASWAFCAAPKPLTENNVMSNACLGDAVRLVEGATLAVSTSTPADACALFGPDTPPGNFRPRDPDGTGGYYQPLRFSGDAVLAVGLLRVTCNLANAPADAARTYAAEYVPNKNPSFGNLRATVDGTDVLLTEIPAGKVVTFEIQWPPADEETFLYFDPATQALGTQKETMRVSWFATAGAFTSAATAPTGPSVATNQWTAPTEPGTVHGWVVLRDSRGGASAASYVLTVR